MIIVIILHLPWWGYILVALGWLAVVFGGIKLWNIRHG